MVDDEGPSRISRSLSARLLRKEQVARGEDVPETLEEEQAAANGPAPGSIAESEEDAALDDDQLLQKYGLTNPEEIEDEASLDAFMQNGLPDRLRQMALRRMWRLNPLFRFADEMVEYGENYTDAATVIDGMTTAYQVGKGYLQKAFDALDDEGGDTEADGLPASGKRPVEQTATRPPATDDEEEETGKAAASDAEQAAGDAGESAAAVPKAGTPDVAASEEASLAVPTQAVPTQDEPPSEEPPRPRPQRMTFRRPAG